MSVNNQAYESPYAKYRGTLDLGGQKVDCYVLDTNDRVISMRATVRALEGTEESGGNLGHYTNARALQPYIASGEEYVDFTIPGIPGKAKGIKADQFMSLCQGFVQALSDGVSLTRKQSQVAVRSAILLSACAKTGLTALIDEATGYQYEREEDALQVKLRAYIANDINDWSKTFPDELWSEFGRLTNWQGALHQRPKYWGHLVLELIYEALDPDVAEYLKNNKPRPKHGQNYHQWLTTDYGAINLDRHIQQIIGIAKTCETMSQLKEKVAHYYKKKPMQLTMTLYVDDK